MSERDDESAMDMPDGAVEIDESFGLNDRKGGGKIAAPKGTIPAPGKQRATQAEIQLRVATVATMIINGFKRHDIVAYINERLLVQWDGLSERGIDRLIQKANKLIQQEAIVDVALEKGKAVSRLDTLYRKCVGAKLFGTALRVQRQINKMHGLDAPLAIRHGNDPDNPMPVQPGANFVVLIQEVEEA